MLVDELDRLDEHARRSAAGVVDPATVRLQYLDEQPDHAARRVELAALFALCVGEPGQKVLVYAAEDVLGAGLGVADVDVADLVDEPAQPLLVQSGTRIVLGQHARERGVVPLDARHRVVDELPDGGLAGLRLEVWPAGFGRDPEDGLGEILVGGARALSLSILPDQVSRPSGSIR